jgi:hypothetical protein
MDEIEGLRGESLLKLSVVNVELAVGGHPVWLDGRDVCADDLGGWVGVGYVHGPNASACADVEDLVRVFDWGFEDAIAQEHGDEVVGYIETVILRIVIGAPILGRLGVLVSLAVELCNSSTIWVGLWLVTFGLT